MKAQIGRLLDIFPYSTTDDRVKSLEYYASFTGGEWMQLSKSLIVVLRPFLTPDIPCSCRKDVIGTQRPKLKGSIKRNFSHLGVKSHHTLLDHYIAITQVSYVDN
jgi:hypothetical protein